MNFIAKVKETVVEYLILSVFALIGIFGFVLWQAVPSTFWQGISDAVDKKVLWAIIGLLFLGIVGESIYLIQSHLRARTTLRHFGGVLWNSNCDLFCPKDETPIYQAGRWAAEDGLPTEVELFQCPKCDSNYVFKNSEGKPITAANAKKNFLLKQSLKTKGSIQAPEMVESLDDVTITVLQAFGGTTTRSLSLDSFTGLLNQGTKPVAISHSLDVLHKKGYITALSIQYVGKNPFYELTPRGRAYIVKNNLVV